MANQIIFGFSLIFALILHAAAIINLPDTDSLIIPGSVDSGKSGLKIGFIGSMGNTLPGITSIIAKEKTSPEPEAIKKKPTPVNALTKKTIPTKVAKKPISKSSIKRHTPAHKIKKKTSNNTKNTIVDQASSGIGIKKNNISTSTGQGDQKNHFPIHGSEHSNTGGGKKGAVQNYQDIIRAWLEKHKRYPRMAQRRKQQGTATLYFKIDRNGKVLKYQISHSSGYSALDHEASAMLQRSAPLPPAPDKIPEQALEFNLPVAFNLTQ